MALRSFYLAAIFSLCQIWLGVCHLSNQEQAPKSPKPQGGTAPPPVSDHRFFLHEIFSKYGHNGQMSFEGFEHLLESLGLGNIIITDHDVAAHKASEFRDIHGTHNHSRKADFTGGKEVPAPGRQSHGYSQAPTTSQTTVTSPNALPRPLHHSHDNHLPHPRTKDNEEDSGQHHYTMDTTVRSESQLASTHPSESIYRYHLREMKIPELLVNISTLVDQHRELDQQSTNIVIEQCLSPRDILEAFGINQSSSLNPVSFLHLCPAIIYELDQGHCLFRDKQDTRDRSVAPLYRWIYSTVAVLVISLCGLLSVAVIPIMQKWFYHTLLQFFVGLAIGSLSGDALLHLLPHAMLGGEENHSHIDPMASVGFEKLAVWRGFAALGGVFFFFIAERLLGSYATYRRRKKAKENGYSNGVEHPNNIGEKLSQYKKNSYDFEKNEKEMIKMLDADNFSSRKNSVDHFRRHSDAGQNSAGHSPNPDCAVALHEHAPHHGHGHTHEVPQSVTAVAWMVIMGDGLHNFCDGLAIGAAFASGIEGGISTAVAVFCHELPHELGDFAMLLKTGMKVKQALFYNGLSSVLCFVGMVIGVSLGNVQSATSWVFAGTAGMFLYIALVDMLPELTNSEDSTAPGGYQLAIQVLGISFGASIMLLIANFEEELQNIIS